MARQGKAARAQIGLVPQELTFHDDLTVRETVTFYARLRRVPSGHDFTALLDHLQLVAHLDKPIRNLSGGLKQRLALALALLCDPPLLLLDEPTANLDIQARDEFIQLLHDLREQGKTLLFSSHRLEEVTALADRVLLLESGRLVVDAPPHELARRLGWAVTLHLYLAEPAIAGALQTLSAAGIPVSRNGSGVRALVDPGEKGHVFRLLYGAGIDVDDFVIE